MAPFAIIPVLDLKGGQVVHARAGERARYLPIRSKLATSSEPRRVLDGILSLARFDAVYIADLDAIEDHGTHLPVIAALARLYEGIEFWVDAGIDTPDGALAIAAAGATPVLGSESLRDQDTLFYAAERLESRRLILSLDYRGDRFLGPPAIENHPESWPDRIIVMTLNRIGGTAGPDFTRLATVQRISGARLVYSAGGVRGTADLENMARIGLAGALVASTLHDGRLTAEALAAFQKR